LPAVK